MSIDFTGVKSLSIPEGIVTQITRKTDGIILWEKPINGIKISLINNADADSECYIRINEITYSSSQEIIVPIGTEIILYAQHLNYTSTYIINNDILTDINEQEYAAEEVSMYASSDLTIQFYVDNNTEYLVMDVTTKDEAEHYYDNYDNIIKSCAVLPPKDTLENMSWSDIQTISKAGAAFKYFNIGDQKTITVDGEEYLVDIIGMDKDYAANESVYGRYYTGITFQLHNCLSTSYSMNSTSTNNGGWGQSFMRTNTMTALFNTLNSDLQNVIAYTQKYNALQAFTTDKLFLLAEDEVYGQKEFSYDYFEGFYYPYYKNTKNRIKTKKDGTSTNWLLRSRVKDLNYFCSLHSDGTAGYMNAMIKTGVSFAFCV